MKKKYQENKGRRLSTYTFDIFYDPCIGHLHPISNYPLNYEQLFHYRRPVFLKEKELDV